MNQQHCRKKDKHYVHTSAKNETKHLGTKFLTPTVDGTNVILTVSCLCLRSGTFLLLLT